MFSFHKLLNVLSRLSPLSHIPSPEPTAATGNTRTVMTSYLTQFWMERMDFSAMLSSMRSLLLCTKQGWIRIRCPQHILQYVYTTVQKVKAIIMTQPINSPLSAVFTFNPSKRQASLWLSPLTSFNPIQFRRTDESCCASPRGLISADGGLIFISKNFAWTARLHLGQ